MKKHNIVHTGIPVPLAAFDEQTMGHAPHAAHCPHQSIRNTCEAIRAARQEWRSAGMLVARIIDAGCGRAEDRPDNRNRA